MKHFIIKRHNRTIGCVWAGKLLPKLPPFAVLGSAPPVIAARGWLNRLLVPRAFGVTFTIVAASAFCSFRVLPPQASIPPLLSGTDAAAFYLPRSLSSPACLAPWSPSRLWCFSSCFAGTFGQCHCWVEEKEPSWACLARFGALPAVLVYFVSWELVMWTQLCACSFQHRHFILCQACQCDTQI